MVLGKDMRENRRTYAKTRPAFFQADRVHFIGYSSLMR